MDPSDKTHQSKMTRNAHAGKQERGKGKSKEKPGKMEAQEACSRGVEKSQDFSQAERSLMRSAVARLFFYPEVHAVDLRIKPTSLK